ncbi:hypothetical protein PFISCL1PPCAC_4342, partial [Pristionchus fissidentatus]
SLKRVADTQDDGIPPKLNKNGESKEGNGKTVKSSLIDLPQEILIQIIQGSNLSLKDRANLRATCKYLESAVAKSEYSLVLWPGVLGTVVISQIVDTQGDGQVTTVVKGLRGSGQARYDIPFENDGFANFVRFIPRLCRRIHINYLIITEFNFKSLSSRENLAKMMTAFDMQGLKITVDAQNYDERMLNMISSARARSLNLNIKGVCPMAHSLLENLPPFESFAIYCGGASLALTNSTFLALVRTQCKSHLFAGTRLISPETILEARKIVAGRGGGVTFSLSLSKMEQLLTLMGVAMHTTRERHRLWSSNRDVMIIAGPGGEVMSRGFFESTKHHFSIYFDGTSLDFNWPTFDRDPLVNLHIH